MGDHSSSPDVEVKPKRPKEGAKACDAAVGAAELGKGPGSVLAAETAVPAPALGSLELNSF